nr:immunoglobulin light chain junction region [Macaca mulatta]MOX83399.1 immunoglobulin light chain junction region [Macaca mulatta]
DSYCMIWHNNAYWVF